MGKKYTTEEFIKKARLVHGDRYDYSLVEYVNAHVNIKIICRKHGIFEQTSNAHLSGCDCGVCSNSIKTIEQFIIDAKLVHGDKYDYSNSIYLGCNNTINIICPKHGNFIQRVNKHLLGRGCPKCGGTCKSTTEEFIIDAKLVHGDKYDYSLVNYTGNKNEIIIICSKHGKFKQTANNHLASKGCPKCAGKYKTTEDFIKEATLIHDNKYDYSLINYINAKAKIKIICPIHGEFNQNTTDHLSGCGCPSCSESKGELAIAKYLNENNIKYEREKIFKECRNKLPLLFDFYLPELNILIEFDGEQHFKSMKYFGGDKAFQLSQINDEIKNKYAKDNNIQLIRIKFNEIKEVNEILDNYIKILII